MAKKRRKTKRKAAKVAKRPREIDVGGLYDAAKELRSAANHLKKQGKKLACRRRRVKVIPW